MSDEYRITAEFSRSLSDNRDPHALIRQFVRELQESYDEGVAGMFQVRSITIDGNTTYVREDDVVPHSPSLDDVKRALAEIAIGRTANRRGKEDLNLEFWVGALAALQLVRHPFSERLSPLVGMVIPSRGLAAVKEMLK